MPRFCNTALLAAALMFPVAVAPTALRAQDRDHRDDRHYHDKGHNDDHEWNGREDQAYRMWVQQNHRKYRDFHELKERDRESYWAWRHEHSDALLKIEIR